MFPFTVLLGFLMDSELFALLASEIFIISRVLGGEDLMRKYQVSLETGSSNFTYLSLLRDELSGTLFLQDLPSGNSTSSLRSQYW